MNVYEGNLSGHMRVPIIHYISFWLINSLMVLGTGLILGLMVYRAIGMILVMSGVSALSGGFLPIITIFPLGFLFGCQFFMASFFWGKRRAEFEYSFLEKSAERGKLNPELRALFREVKQELRSSDPKAAYLKLKAAIELFPDNFVLHFKYALSCETVELSEEAIAAYISAEKLLPTSAKALITYVEKQINRVKLEGPTKHSSAPGLQYIIY
jgi:hypothetical protein